jgi:hypothetical protein
MDLRDRSISVTQTNLAKKESLVKKARNKLKKIEKQALKAKEEIEATESEWEVAEFQNEIFKRKRNIEEIFWRFPHIGKQILEKIDNPSVANCRQVNKWWCNFVEGKALLIRKIQRHICISSVKLRKSLNNLSLEILTQFEDHVRVDRRFNVLRQSLLRKNDLEYTEPYTMREFSEQVFNILITYPDHYPCIPVICNLMLDKMKNKNPTCRIYGTALHRVTSNNKFGLFRLIYENIENKSPKDTPESENTPLHIAAENGCHKITRFILKNSNADNINRLNKYGKTPLNLAEENDHKDICKLLTTAISKQNKIPRNPREKRKIT